MIKNNVVSLEDHRVAKLHEEAKQEDLLQDIVRNSRCAEVGLPTSFMVAWLKLAMEGDSK